MLTKNDFDQIGKLVQKIVRQEVKVEVKDSTRTLDSQIRLSRMQVQQDISELDDRMKNVEVGINTVDSRLNHVETRLDGIEKDITDVKTGVRKTEKTVSLIAKNYDEGDVMLARRVKKLEQHVGLQP